LGQRLSGWVGANRQTISNSDATLDLGDVAKAPSVRVRTCLSTALLVEDELVGVLSLYSSEPNGFSEDHKRIIEAVARQIAHTFKSATEFDSFSRRDSLTGLPNLDQLEHLLDATAAQPMMQRSAVTLLFIDIVGLKEINSVHGRSVGDEALRHVVRHTTAGLRVADILFRYGSDEFVALVNDTAPDVANTIAGRIVESVHTNRLPLPGNAAIQIDVCVTEVSSPRDGNSLAKLIDTARSRMSPVNDAKRRALN
jgi:diguanylate cyclase (GGDEF)-like protein